MRIDPKTHTLASFRSRSLSHAEAMAELIDNALDAGALSIRIEIDSKRIMVEDDGHGVTPDGLRSMVTVGAHGEGNDSGLGIYGVGFNLAALWLADEVEIASLRRGTIVWAQVNWKRVEKSGDWEVPDPIVVPATPEQRGAFSLNADGTRITFTKLLRGVLHGQNFEKMTDRLRFCFTPALQAGKQIVIKGTPLTPFEMPACAEQIAEDLIVADRPVRVRCGVVQTGHDNPFLGFAVAFRHRYIKKSSVYCKDYPAARVAGEITLGPEWHADLSDHKNALVRHEDELIDAVHAACIPIFERAKTQAQALHLDKLSKRASELISTRDSGGDGDPDAKAKRKRKQNKSGPVLPTGSGNKHQRAEKTQPGASFSARLKRGVAIEWAALGEGPIAACDVEAVRVTLNTDHASVRRFRDEANDHGIAVLATSLLAHHQLVGQAQKVFTFSADSFETLVGLALGDRAERMPKPIRAVDSATGN